MFRNKSLIKRIHALKDPQVAFPWQGLPVAHALICRLCECCKAAAPRLQRPESDEHCMGGLAACTSSARSRALSLQQLSPKIVQQPPKICQACPQTCPKHLPNSIPKPSLNLSKISQACPQTSHVRLMFSQAKQQIHQ